MKIVCKNHTCLYYQPGAKGVCSCEHIVIGEEGCETFIRSYRWYMKKMRTAMNRQGDIPADELTRDVEIGIDFYRRIFHLTIHPTDKGICFHKDGWKVSYDKLLYLYGDTDEEKRIFAETENGMLDRVYPNFDTDQIAYGWLAPDGTFVKASFGEYETAAHRLIRMNGWLKDYVAWEELRTCGTARKYLTDVKGYVLIHNDYRDNDSGCIDASQALTDNQKKYLHSYYKSVGDELKATLYAE